MKITKTRVLSERESTSDNKNIFKKISTTWVESIEKIWQGDLINCFT